ncbi:MAG: NAD(P)-dependent alcohol dehydrogenase [Planctomycetota bacterium]|nr:NAD(P)-dependent alcohol dehydrogenase [Planctomycetota bacterium]
MKTAAMVADAPKGTLHLRDIELGELRPDQVEIAVEHCGICHSDLSMRDNEWGMTAYPFVPGHEVVGRVAAVGSQVKTVRPGQRVGLGWFAQSCMHCRQCMTGNHNLCPTGEQTIVGRMGGFASRVRCGAEWAIAIPEGLDAASAGPLFCGGITVFNPIVQFGVKPTDRVGVVGIGGLGHLALQFLNKWGCEVVAFTSTGAKQKEAMDLGAHRAVDSRSDADLAANKGTIDFLLVTANVTLNWQAYLDVLAPRGRMHMVGAVLEPIPVPAFALIAGQKQISGTPLGSPATTAQMLEFAARHKVRVVNERFKMRDANKAFEHLHAGKARYRLILDNDLG